MANKQRIHWGICAFLLILVALGWAFADESSRLLLEKMRKNKGGADRAAYSKRTEKPEKVEDSNKPAEKINVVEVREKRPVTATEKVIGGSVELEPLDIIPADSLLCVRINNIEFTAGKFDQYSSGVIPVPMAASMGLRMGLGTVLGSPQLAGINMRGNFAAFVKATKISKKAQIPQCIRCLLAILRSFIII